MKNPYLIILLIASLTSTLAQDCNNPLLGIYGLTGLGSPQSGAGIPFCTNLQSAQTCCSADTINSFQGRLDGFINNLNLYDAARDLYIAQLRNRFFESFQDLLNSIDDNNLDDNLAAIREVNDTLADQLQSEISTFTQLNTDAQNISNNFGSVLDDFQVARNNCFAAALQVQASSWCLACDPNYATRGVNSDGTVTFGDSLCQQINDACLPYFDQSARFNPLINARAAYWRLQAVAAYLNNFADTNRVTDFIVPQDPFNPLPSQLNVTVPAQWAPGGTEQCSNLWARDQNLAGLLRIGNSVPTVTNAGTRLLQNSLAGAAGVWAPDLSVTVLSLSGLSNDPGDYFGVRDYSDLNLNEFENGEGEIDVDDNPDIIIIDNRST